MNIKNQTKYFLVWAIIAFNLSGMFSLQAVKTEWVVLQTTFEVDSKDPMPEVSECQCAYCGHLFKEPNQDIQKNKVCLSCGQQMESFLQDKDTMFQENINNIGRQRLQDTFPDAKFLGINIEEVVKSLREAGRHYRIFPEFSSRFIEDKISDCTIQCQNCGKYVSPEAVVDHAICHYKKPCQHCNIYFGVRLLPIHEFNCPKKQIVCQVAGCNQPVAMESYGEHIVTKLFVIYDGEESHDVVSCPLCNRPVSGLTYQEHFEALHQHHESLPCECPVCNECFGNGQQLLDHAFEKHPSSVVRLMSSRSTASGAHVQEDVSLPEKKLHNILKVYQECMNHHQKGICPLTEKLEELEISHNKLNQSVKSVMFNQKTLEHVSYDGTYVWRFPDVEACRKNAREKSTPFGCMHFYTKRTGYKLKLIAFLNGYGEAEGKSFSLYMSVLKGEFDPTLQWPFKPRAYIMLFDQSGNYNHITLLLESETECFQKPGTDIDKKYCIGFHHFCPLEYLNPEGVMLPDGKGKALYVKDDTMLIKCECESRE